MTGKYISALCALILGFAAMPAAAQQTQQRAPAPQSAPAVRKAPAAPPAAAPSPLEAPPPYEPQMMRLSEILGSLAYLRELCGAPDGDRFHARMAALLEAEATTEARRDRLAGAYNSGYRGFATTYRTCTDNAQLVIARYLDEAGRIARELASRYSGG
ncbi:MAG: hypothetical protein JWL62_1485 [Hyphomicrobiales bacterium]|nr:hypothetical protein [Hyphomicrobiales bacterium]